MSTSNDSPILVTGAAGEIESIGRHLSAMLIAKGHKVRAMVRREDERAKALRQLGDEIAIGDLTDLQSVHRAVKGCKRIYFSMSAAYLEATVNFAAVARHHGVEAIVNLSQMTVTGMSITETTDSPQHKLHWLAEQALTWLGLPVVTVRPTVFMESFFLRLAVNGVREADELVLPLGNAKSSPIAAVDVARVGGRDSRQSHTTHRPDLQPDWPRVGRSGSSSACLLRSARPCDSLPQCADLGMVEKLRELGVRST